MQVEKVRPHSHHIADAAKLTPWRQLVTGVHGFNAKVAVVITDVLGSMPFFWVSCVLALLSLPAVLTLVDDNLKLGVGLHHFFPHWLIDASIVGLVAWVAQTFIQLVALSVLQVSNNAQGKQQDHNTQVLLEDGAATREHTEVIMDCLDIHTEGGLSVLLKAVNDLPGKIAKAKGKH